MSETFRSRMDKANNCLSQLRSVGATLEYWEGKTTPERAKLLRLAKEAVKIVEEHIYSDELSGVARFKEG